MTEHAEPIAPGTGRHEPAAARPTAVPSPTVGPMTVGAVDDPAEREADAIAAAVVRRLAGGRAAGGDGSSDEPPAEPDAPSSGRIRRAFGPSTSAASVDPAVIGPGGGQLDEGTAGRIRRAEAGGRPLDEGIRSPMERAVGASLAHVRIHRGPEANTLARTMSARAFTTGPHVFLADGEGDAHSTRGQHTLAHEVAHVLQADRGVRRVFGWGNAGRRERDVERAWADATSSPEEAAAAIESALRAPRTSALKRFNQLMSLLQRDDVRQVHAAYTRRGGLLRNEIGETFGWDSFRTDYLNGLITRNGEPAPIMRLRLALGEAGGGAVSVVSDAAEVVRLFHGLDLADQTTMMTGHRDVLRAGLSPKAFKQIEAEHGSAKAMAPDGSAGIIGPAPKPRLTKLAAETLLASQDRELGKIVSRAKKGEGTSALGNALSVKLTFNMDRLLDDLTDWVARAKSIEAKFFDGLPVIRRFVLAADVEVPVSDPSKVATIKNAGREFQERMTSRTYLKGWNRGDRQMIRLIITSGATTPPSTDSSGSSDSASTSGSSTSDATGGPNVDFDDVDISSSGSSDLQERLREAIGRTGDPKVIAALAALAAEITIQHTFGADSRAERLVKNFMKLDATSGAALYAAIIGPTWMKKDPETAVDVARLQLVRMLEAAKVKDKERKRITAQLDPKLSKENLVALRRYIAKSSIEIPQISKLLVALDEEEMGIVRADRSFVRAILEPYRELIHQYVRDLGWTIPGARHHVGLAHVERVLDHTVELGPDASSMTVTKGAPTSGPPATTPSGTTAPTSATSSTTGSGTGSNATGASPSTTATSPAPDAAKVSSLTARWALALESARSEKAAVSFATTVLSEVGRSGLVAVYDQLAEEHGYLADRLRRYSELGKELHKLEGRPRPVADSDFTFDVVGAVVKAAQTRRPGGSADLDTAISAFENMSGEQLLVEWTNIADYQEVLGARHRAMQEIAVEMTKLTEMTDDAPGRDAAIDEVTTKVKALHAHNVKIGATFRLGLSRARRTQLNKTGRNLKTTEFLQLDAKFAKHLSGELRTPEMKTALVQRHLFPEELEVLGEQVLFIADRDKEAAMASWVQWAGVTVKGQLREESAGLLTKRFRTLRAVASGTGPGDLADARKGFGEQRDELARRTKSFETTARKYANRVKQIIGFLLDVVIIAATMGIGTVPVVAASLISSAMSFAKDVVLAATSKILMPTESNLAVDVTLSLVKNMVMAGVNIGIGHVMGHVNEGLGLVDSNGLGRGRYLLPDGRYVESTGTATAGFRGMTVESFFAESASTLAETAMTNVSERVVDTLIAAATTDGEEAFTNFVKNWSWNDLYANTIGPLLKQMVSKGVAEMQGELRKVLEIEDATTTTGPDGKEYVVMKAHDPQLGAMGSSALDDSYKSVNAFDDVSFGREFGVELMEKIRDDTFVAFVEWAIDLPADRLTEALGRRTQSESVAEGKGTKSKPDEFTQTADQAKQLEEFRQLIRLAKLSATATNVDEVLRHVNAAIQTQRALGKQSKRSGRPRSSKRSTSASKHSGASKKPRSSTTPSASKKPRSPVPSGQGNDT